MHTITLKIDNTFYEMITKMIKNLGIRKSELIRHFITHYREAIAEEQPKELDEMCLIQSSKSFPKN